MPFPLLPLFPFPPLPLLPVPLLPLPVAPVPLLPLPELPLDTLLVEPAVVATVVVTLEDADVALAGEAPLLRATAVTLELLEAVVVVLIALSLHTVAVAALAFVLRTRPDATAPWASPFVTLWTFSLTSPSELEMRTTPPLGA